MPTYPNESDGYQYVSGRSVLRGVNRATSTSGALPGRRDRRRAIPVDAGVAAVALVVVAAAVLRPSLFVAIAV
jgi:hypothetical protein